MRVRAYVGLGSNLGDSARTLDSACQELGAAAGVRLLRRSANMCSAPVGGPPGQPDYHNGVVELDTELAARDLLGLLHAIEREHGREREREQRWGPRTLDLDLLLYADLVCETAQLELPHPRIEERLFVLMPLAELVPDLILPGSGRSVGSALRELCEGSGLELGEACL